MTRARFLAGFALASYAAFVATVLLMPSLKDGYSQTGNTISEGALGEYGWLQVMGFLALALGTLAIALMLHDIAPSARVSVTVVLLVISSLSVVALAFIQTDAPGERTLQGRIHLFAAGTAFVAAIGAMLWSAHGFRAHAALQPLSALSLVAGSMAAALLAITASGLDPSGFWQRLTVWCELAWFIAVALRLGFVRYPVTSEDLRARARARTGAPSHAQASGGAPSATCEPPSAAR